MYCLLTGILFLWFLAATVESRFSFISDRGVRIFLNSSTVSNLFWRNSALYNADTIFFFDSTHVESYMVNANFFKDFCEAQDLLTPHERSHVLISTRKLLLDGGKNQFRVPVRAPTGQNDPPPTSISFRLSAWGAKHYMPCGVLLINFDTRKSYMNFLYNKSAFYEDLCHLKSKCLPVGTYLPLTSSATFEVGFGRYYQQAMIVNEGVMVDGTVSEIIDAESLLGTFRNYNVRGLNINPALVCKYAKRSLCNYGLAGRSAVFRYLPSATYYHDEFLHLCSSKMFNNTVLFDFKVALPLENEIYVHSEVVVIKPLRTHFFFEDDPVNISEVTRDPRVIHTIEKYRFLIIISFIVFINCLIVFIKYKKQVFDLSFIFLTYCFRIFVYILNLYIYYFIIKIICYGPLQLTAELVYAWVSFLVMSFVFSLHLQLKVIPALLRLLKVNKPMMTTSIIILSFQKVFHRYYRRSQNVSNTPGITFV